MKIDEKKLKKVVELLYVKEIVGKALYEKINDYPTIKEKADELTDAALNLELSILTKNNNYERLKESTKEKLLELDKLSSENKYYRKSLLFFDENLNYVDSF